MMNSLSSALPRKPTKLLRAPRPGLHPATFAFLNLPVGSISSLRLTFGRGRHTCSCLGTTFTQIPSLLFSFQELFLSCSLSMSTMERQTYQDLKRISYIEQEACTEDAAWRNGETARNCFEIFRICRLTGSKGTTTKSVRNI